MFSFSVLWEVFPLSTNHFLFFSFGCAPTAFKVFHLPFFLGKGLAADHVNIGKDEAPHLVLLLFAPLVQALFSFPLILHTLDPGKVEP